MTRLAAHLIRGTIAAALIAWALLHTQTQPALAIAAGVVAVIAMRGCPACWMLGLFETISETIKVRRAGSSTVCSLSSAGGASIEPTRPLRDTGF